MSRCINQLGLGLVALVLMVFMALPASAQAAGWQPKFDAGQHVYVDPALANHASYPVNLSGLSKQLETVSDKHGVSVYVVAIERTTEGGAVPAVGRVNDLVLRWQGQADFPHDRFLVILWLRYADDPSQGSVAVNAGSELRQYNLTSSDLNSPSGPVNAAIKKYMPHDPNGAWYTSGIRVGTPALTSRGLGADNIGEPPARRRRGQRANALTRAAAAPTTGIR